MSSNNNNNKKDPSSSSSKCLNKSNILVFQQPSGERIERKKNDCKMKIPICTPKPHPIKICTGAQLRKMCPPKVCPCTPPKPNKFGILKLFGFGLKSIIAASAIYITYDMGIWGSTEETQGLYGAACTIFSKPQPKKSTKWDPPSCEAESDFFTTPQHKPFGHCEEPPLQIEDIRLKLKELWNRGISKFFHTLVEFPQNLTSLNLSNEGKSSQIEKKPCKTFYELSDEERAKLLNKYK